jgi:SAM-dependent methyltransferase
LVDLSCLAENSIDNAICLFSTLGMIEGDENRQAALAHIHRILVPDGIFVAHVHNLWHNLFDPEGPWWLLGNLARSRGRLVNGRGDRQFDYRGIRNFFLHAFTGRELNRMLSGVGFRIERRIPVGRSSDGRLSCPWLLGVVRAQGWIVVCRKKL